MLKKWAFKTTMGFILKHNEIWTQLTHDLSHLKTHAFNQNIIIN